MRHRILLTAVVAISFAAVSARRAPEPADPVRELRTGLACDREMMRAELQYEVITSPDGIYPPALTLEIVELTRRIDELDGVIARRNERAK